MKKIVILGASGSIGQQTLDLIREYPNEFELIGVSVHTNTQFLDSLLNEFPSIECACITSDKTLENKKVTHNLNDVIYLNCDIVVNAIAGTDGLIPSIETVKAGHTLCLANKETIILGGDAFRNLKEEYPDMAVIPLDSEHNSILQLLQGEYPNEVNKWIITASGGPFKNYSLEEMNNITVEQAINHPTWKMGKKISVDSATLFNKGMEVLELHYLFNIDINKIDVLINPTSIVHALVSFRDGTSKLLLSNPDMRLPILYGISLGERLENKVPKLDLTKLNEIKFEQVDNEKFPALKLAYEVGNIGGNAPLVYCVANEVAVDHFMKEEIKFLDIYKIVAKVIKEYEYSYDYSLDEIPAMVEDVKKFTLKIIKEVL